MKPMKLTSLMVMLLVCVSAAAQEEFFDDFYFSSSKKYKKEKTEQKVIQPKEDAERTTMTLSLIHIYPFGDGRNRWQGKRHKHYSLQDGIQIQPVLIGQGFQFCR